MDNSITTIATATKTKTDILTAIIRPLQTASYEVDYEWRSCEQLLDFLSQSGQFKVELIPDFQRGHVWTQAQQEHFIENVFRGVVAPSGLTIRFNAPEWEEPCTGDLPNTVQCIDGLQRLTAVRRFIAGEIKAFGMFAEEFNDSRFRVLKGASGYYRLRIAVHTFQNRADLLQHYMDLNAGGTPHSQEEIERVRSLLHQLT